jgi:hypothetical protein
MRWIRWLRCSPPYPGTFSERPLSSTQVLERFVRPFLPPSLPSLVPPSLVPPLLPYLVFASFRSFSPSPSFHFFYYIICSPDFPLIPPLDVPVLPSPLLTHPERLTDRPPSRPPPHPPVHPPFHPPSQGDMDAAAYYLVGGSPPSPSAHFASSWEGRCTTKGGKEGGKEG